jgi:hypothetical protein
LAIAVGFQSVSDRSHDLVDLEWCQEGWLFFQPRTPFLQNTIRPPSLMIAFINDLLDGYFYFFKQHQQFLLVCGIATCNFNRKSYTDDSADNI